MQSLVDMTLMCSSHTLRVHKAVLAASSAYFQDVLQTQSGEPLIILKMRFSVLKCLVEFMYCGKTQCLEENLDELVAAAQFLQIKGLSKVTKEGLGITNHSELPVFPPPVVINRPPSSTQNEFQPQDNYNMNMTPDPKPPQPPPQMAPATSTSQPGESLVRPNKDMVVRIPFDIENGSGNSSGNNVDFSETMKPRRGRPTVRRGGSGWDNSGALGRAAERALLRREQDSRKAIHQLKHLQSRTMKDYMERMSLSQAVNSICGPETSSARNYMNIDNDLMYMDQTVSSNVHDPTIAYNKDHAMTNETITSSYTDPTNPESNTGISNAMSQYVNALKSAGLPTDLPILFESGDGSYINVNEQVLLDMVQSSEIQYEVIEQPNIIEKVADPSEIKSIDDLSKSIERGEMMIGPKSYPENNYSKDTNQFRHEDAMNSLNSILPDDLESFAEQQNYVVLDTRLQDSNNMDQSNDFSCIDGDMQFFTKSMSDDVKKYYEDNQLNDARVMEQLCPTSTTLDTNFSISLLDTKSSHLNGNLGQQYNPLNPEDLRRNEDCYDFGLQLPQTADLDCLIATPKRTDDNPQHAKERDEIIKDLMNIESNIARNDANKTFDSNVQDFNDTLNVDAVFDANSIQNEMQKTKETDMLSSSIAASGLQWDTVDMTGKESEEITNIQMPGSTMDVDQANDLDATGCRLQNSAMDFDQNRNMPLIDTSDKENVPGLDNECALENDIPFAVGLLPLKPSNTDPQVNEDSSLLKRKNSIDELLENVDAKCLKRKVKYKKL
ncbi:BTB/POZ domain-containing protein [Phthorimaea operculella]|nr:BTB/POZ domain-containing protein [Phthorimaea operculella]